MRKDQESPVIIEVEPIPLFLPFRSEYHFSAGARPGVEVLLVRIRASDGRYGVGETQAWRRRGASETLPGLTAAITEHLAPRLIGRSPRNMLAIMHDLEEALDGSLYAKAAISDALYDLSGKICHRPVHQLMGGRCRDALGACAVLSIQGDLAATIADAERWFARGYRSFTIKIGQDPSQDYRVVRALREQFGDEVLLRVDANAGLGFDAALRLLKRLEPFDLDAAEQPLAPGDVEGMADLARRVDIPLMADESLCTQQDLIRIIRHRAASVIQTKQAKNGGIFYARRLWTIAEAAGLRIYPGNHPCTSIGTAAVVQMAAAWPGPLLDGPFAYGVADLLQHDLVQQSLTPQNAKVAVSDDPGLGITLDEEAVARFRIDGRGAARKILSLATASLAAQLNAPDLAGDGFG